MSPAQLLGITLGLFALGALLVAAAGRRVDPAVRRGRWLKLAVYFLVVHGVLGCAALGRGWLIALVSLLLAAGTLELRGALRTIAVTGGIRAPAIMAIWVALCAGLLVTVLCVAPGRFALLYLVVAGFDGFSQVTGQLVGKRALVPRLSPAKTVEGLAGGVLAAFALAWAFHPLGGMGPGVALALAPAVAACALAGDLGASLVKRRAGIKDFGTLIPGHGGVLDRFDSLIGAGALLSPVATVLGGR